MSVANAAQVNVASGEDYLEAAFCYLSVAVAVHPTLTAMNWRAQCLKLLRRWDEALEAFRENLALAKQDSSEAHVELAERMIALCELRKATDPPSPKPKNVLPARDPAYATLALSFVEALLDGDFRKAHGLLSPSLEKSVSEKNLARSLRSIVSPTKPSELNFEVIETMDEWPDKKPNDVGWVYVALNGADTSEALAVIVAKGKMGLVIRAIEWGRP